MNETVTGLSKKASNYSS